MPTTKDRELSAVNDQRDALLLTMDAYYEIKVSLSSKNENFISFLFG